MKRPSSAQLPDIESLLVENDLPIDDLGDQDLSLFRIKESNDQIDAVGGLERFGRTALLRSVVTSADMRGRGVAGEIVSELERLAAAEGFESIYLLTESAQDYFASKGYNCVARSKVPDSIKESRQFSSLCPDTAIVMCKPVGK